MKDATPARKPKKNEKTKPAPIDIANARSPFLRAEGAVDRIIMFRLED
jgi:hypothetical protein